MRAVERAGRSENTLTVLLLTTEACARGIGRMSVRCALRVRMSMCRFGFVLGWGGGCIVLRGLGTNGQGGFVWRIMRGRGFGPVAAGFLKRFDGAAEEALGLALVAE